MTRARAHRRSGCSSGSVSAHARQLPTLRASRGLTQDRLVGPAGPLGCKQINSLHGSGKSDHPAEPLTIRPNLYHLEAPSGSELPEAVFYTHPCSPFTWETWRFLNYASECEIVKKAAPQRDSRSQTCNRLALGILAVGSAKDRGGMQGISFPVAS